MSIDSRLLASFFVARVSARIYAEAMRLVTLVVAIFLLAPQTPAAAVVSGFDSAYAGESAFLSVSPGTRAPFQVFFMNTGTTTWRKGTATQVNLTVCLENKVSCNLPSPHSDWNDGTWVSDRVYATHFQDEVVPGVVASFSYGIKVPLTAASGYYRFNGDLALPNGQQIHPEGYYQEAVIPSGDQGN
jgi:hypothetical protein